MSDDESLTKDYGSLMEKSKELTILRSATAILQWDMETKMPPKGIQLKSEQLALLEQIGHKMVTDQEVGSLLDKIEKHRRYSNLGQVPKRNVHLYRKAYDEATELPERLVAETAKQSALTVDAWKKAKVAKDWGMFYPNLKKMYELVVELADILQTVKNTKNPYDALIDIYEPKMTADIITILFTEMRKGLQRILERIQSSEKPEISSLKRLVPIETQRKIADNIADFILFDVKSDQAGGRIDETEHPFTAGYYHDVRITTNYHENRFFSSVYSVLHEGGHALYEQGLPDEWLYQPVGNGASMGVHESMSRFVENIVGRSPEFWTFFLPVLKDLAGDTFKDVSHDQIMAASNYVTPSKIRVEADEVTYGMHIIIRFELERDLFNGDLTIKELPQAWNQKYEDYLGVEIEDDSEGVMQDIHWASGSFGYFPSYALGNLYDGVWLKKLNKDLPMWKSHISTGSFIEVKNWLNENVYKYGNLYDPEELVKLVTGKGLTVKPFIEYLYQKLKPIYKY